LLGKGEQLGLNSLEESWWEVAFLPEVASGGSRCLHTEEVAKCEEKIASADDIVTFPNSVV